MAKAGRPSKLTPELINEVCTLIEGGNYIDVAVACVGIDRSTFFKWVQSGAKAKSGIKKEFCDRIKIAQAKGETKSVALVHKAGKVSWQAAMTHLERRHPDRWARKDFLTVQGKIDHIHQLPDDQLRDLVGEALKVSNDGMAIDITPEDKELPAP